MLFNSFEFIFVFLPIVLLAYFGLNRLNLHQWAKGVLVLASLYFYAFFNTSYLPIIVSSILVNYGVAVGMRKWDGVTKKVLFGIGLLFNLGMLGYFKYTDFMIENVNALFNTNYTLKNILLPLGISFFTFQQLAFVVDTYKNKGRLPKFLDYCNFVTFFPQLIAGPIVLPEEMLPQFEDKANRNPRAKNLFDGIFIFSVGLAKKVIIADSIAVFANAGYNLDLPHYTMAEAWLISLSYTFQLYFDFSGYCDMAIGIGKMFNINLPLNFNAPYRATNFQDFWRRWHMTLNRFLTQYVYIPLGGSRRKEVRVYFNIGIVFLISGIWHGAGWTFVVWGICHGIGVMIHRIWKKKGYSMPSWLGMFITFFFINILWVLFRADNMHEAWVIISSMFDNHQFYLSPAYTSHLPSILPNSVNMMILFFAMLAGVIGPTAYQICNDYGWYRAKQAVTVICFVGGVLFISRVVTFLYFNF
jgi:alginate O-acetyltransferase complex protein AlgI